MCRQVLATRQVSFEDGAIMAEQLSKIQDDSLHLQYPPFHGENVPLGSLGGPSANGAQGGWPVQTQSQCVVVISKQPSRSLSLLAFKLALRPSLEGAPLPTIRFRNPPNRLARSVRIFPSLRLANMPGHAFPNSPLTPRLPGS
jgi:hypothetical protein